MRARAAPQDLCIAAAVEAFDCLPNASLEQLPSDLLQRVFDELVATDKFCLSHLSRFNDLDLDTVVLVGSRGGRVMGMGMGMGGRCARRLRWGTCGRAHACAACTVSGVCGALGAAGLQRGSR